MGQLIKGDQRGLTPLVTLVIPLVLVSTEALAIADEPAR
jgi:hypothetical protein